MDYKEYGLSPEKITESFVWFCFSRLTEEDLEDHIVEYKNVFRDDILNEVKNSNKPLKEELDKIAETSLENNYVESEKKVLDSVWVNKMVEKLGFSKTDYKTIVKNVMKQVVKDYD